MSTIYRKGEVLGWGSAAAVHYGWDELLDRPVAIKELKQPFSGNEVFSRAFRTQALRMLDLSHCHVLATYAVDSDRNIHSVIRELADETLGQRSFHGPVEPETALKILRAALLGLDALHGRDLIHRAVKPENIFVCKDTYKIGDFGLPLQEGIPPVPARRFRYSAPEEILQPEFASRESDIYSLGCVIYELILGPLRFEQAMEELLRATGELRESGTSGGSRDEIWLRFHASALELPPLLDLEPGVPASLSLTLRKMVVKDRRSRFATCRQVLASLGSASPARFAEKQDVHRVHDNVSAGATKDGNWAWIAGGALTISAILALAIWGLASRQPQVSHPPSEENTSSQTLTATDSLLHQTPGATSGAGVPDPASRLIGQLSQAPEAMISLNPPGSGAHPSLTLGTPLSFRVTSDQSGDLLLFTLSSDGSISCLYPNPGRPSLSIRSNQELVLPAPEEGLSLIASHPLGRQIVFLLHSPIPLPTLPPAESGSSPVWEYPSRGGQDDPARGFVDWVSKLLRTRREATLSMVEFEVVAAR
jgi:serine/threonine protein kinase